MVEAKTRRLAYLKAMGIQSWTLRLQPPRFHVEEETDSALPEDKETGSGRESLLESGVLDNVPDAPRPASGADRTIESAAAVPESSIGFGTCGWDDLQAQVAGCVSCPLHRTRTQTVFGVGDRTAHWMVIGEAPGEQEDLQGEPFVGRAGLLLNEMLWAIGLAREQVFIANILKCRPPKNRDPQPEEVAACEHFLKQQLALVKPKIILAVGRVAAQNLLKTATPIGKLRSVVHDYQGVPLVVTYHPAYLLRSPLEKRRAFEDLRLALRTYRQAIDC